MSFTAPQLQCSEFRLLLFTYWILHPACRLQAFEKQQVSASKDWQASEREREENLSWSYSNLLLHVWSERSDVLTTLGWLLPSAEPRLQSCTTMLSSAELNCQTLMAKTFPVQPNLLQVGFSKRILVFFLGGPCSLHVQPRCDLFHWPCHFKTDWFL